MLLVALLKADELLFGYHRTRSGDSARGRILAERKIVRLKETGLILIFNPWK